MRRHVSAALLAALVVGAPFAFSNEATDTKVDEEVVVTATRVPQATDDATELVTVIERDRIERSAAVTLDDLLRSIPGFGLFRRTSSVVAQPTTQGASLRGISPSGASRVAVLVDGMPINDPFGGWVAWSRIPLESVERVEVLRGGASSVWGDHALGGVVNVVTRADEGAAAAARIGTEEERAATIQLGGSRGSLSGGLVAAIDRSDGYEVIREDQRGAIDVAAYSDNESVAAHGTLELGARTRATARASWFDEERGNGTPLTGNATTITSGRVGLRHEDRRGALWRVDLRLRDHDFSSTFSAQAEDRSSERPALDQFAVEGREALLFASHERSFGDGHRLTLGLDARAVDGETNERYFWDGERFLRRREAGGEQQLVGAFASTQLELSRRLRLDASVRLDAWRHLDGFRDEIESAGGASLRRDRYDDRSELAVSPRVGVRRALGEAWSLRASAYRSFRAPSINELYRPFRVRNDITEANAELEPETLTGVDAGLDWQDGGASARVTAFWNRLDDGIANVTLAEADVAGPIAPCGFVPEGGSCRQRRNLGRVRTLGVEAEVSWRLGAGFRVEVAHLYTDGEVRDAPDQPSLVGRRPAQVAEHQSTLAIGWTGRRVEARVLTRHHSEAFEDDLNRRRLAPFSTLDASLRVVLGRGFDLIASVENAFDETIETGRTSGGLVAVGMPRLAHLGLRWTE